MDLQLWSLIFLQPLDLQECTVPHLKDLINICLKKECQGHGMTFNMILVAQSTLISYHTEAFVKTEVACTVLYNGQKVSSN